MGLVTALVQLFLCHDYATLPIVTKLLLIASTCTRLFTRNEAMIKLPVITKLERIAFTHRHINRKQRPWIFLQTKNCEPWPCSPPKLSALVTQLIHKLPATSSILQWCTRTNLTVKEGCFLHGSQTRLYIDHRNTKGWYHYCRYVAQ